MGIEPTSDALTPLNGFEDRGGHQTSKLFPVVGTLLYLRFPKVVPVLQRLHIPTAQASCRYRLAAG